MEMMLPSDIQQKVDAQLASGRFSDAETVLNEALNLFAEHLATLDDLRASVADIEAGRVRPLNDVADEIRVQHGWS